MRFRILPLLAWLMAAPLPAAAQGFDAWTTMLRIRTFTDLLATRDAVWCASGEGGLLRFDRDTLGFQVIRRVPGGIASNRLTALAMDGRGRLWVGTRSNGVSRLSADGSRWDAVNVLDGLPVDSVQVIEAQGDTVWIGAGRGIALWNGDEISGSLPDGNTVSYDTTFAAAPITGIAVLDDAVWVSSRRGIGYAHLSSGLTDWRPANDGIPGRDVDNLASDGVGVFAVSEGFVYRWSGTQWERYNFAVNNPVFNMVDDAGIVVISTADGIWTHDGTRFVQAPGSPSAPNYFTDEPTVDSTGVIFMANESGLWRETSPATWTVAPKPEGPPGNLLNSVVVDGPRVYVTAWTEGVGRFDGRSWRIWEPGRCVSDCDTTFLDTIFAFATLVDRRGRKWTSQWSSAIEQFDDSVSPPRFTHRFVVGTQDSALHTFAKSSVVDSAGRVWLGLDTNNSAVTPIGLDLYDSSGVFVRNFNPNNQTGMSGTLVHTLTVSRNRRLWIGYDDKGVDFVELDRLPFNENQLAFNAILSTTGIEVRGIAAYGDSIWMLTLSELRRYSASANTAAQPIQVYSLSGAGGSSQFTAHPLDVGPDGSVWAGTLAGVYRFRPGVSTPDRFTTANSPLADNEVRSIVVDRATGVVWIATAAGLSRYDPGYVPPDRTLPSLHVRVYPNPAVLNGAGLRLRISGEGSAYQGAIYDIAGRRVRGFSAPRNGSVFWDGRDDSGTMVQPGVYFVRAEAGGRSAVTRIALVQ